METWQIIGFIIFIFWLISNLREDIKSLDRRISSLERKDSNIIDSNDIDFDDE